VPGICLSVRSSVRLSACLPARPPACGEQLDLQSRRKQSVCRSASASVCLCVYPSAQGEELDLDSGWRSLEDPGIYHPEDPRVLLLYRRRLAVGILPVHLFMTGRTYSLQKLHEVRLPATLRLHCNAVIRQNMVLCMRGCQNLLASPTDSRWWRKEPDRLTDTDRQP
jgi:hypothetical protein